MKNPDNMNAEERLARIRSLERKVARVEHELDFARRDEASVRRWAEEAWTEVRRCHDLLSQRWEEMQQIRAAAGLAVEPSLVPLATWNPETREWTPITDEDALVLIRGAW